MADSGQLPDEMQGTPHKVDNLPPERDGKSTPGDENPERQGPNPDPGSPAEDDDEQQVQSKEPPPESIPGDQGGAPNPKR